MTIPHPPQDPALGRFATALDGAAMAALLAPPLAARGLVLRGCRPDYARLRPGAQLLVRYALSVERDGRTSELPAHAALLRPGKAERARRKTGPDPRAFVVPELGALVAPFPVDAKLRGLVAAADPACAARLLGDAAPAAAASLAAPWTVDVIRYKPRRRAVLRYAGAGGGALYAKLRSDDRGAAMAATGRRLADAGLPTPAPLAYLPDLRLVAYPAAAGTRLKDLRGRPAYARWMDVVAEVLARLHAMPPAGLPPHDADAEAAELAAAAAAAAALVPSLAARAGTLAADIAARIAAAEGRPATVHGSFHDDQVLVCDAGATLLDLDSATAGTAAMDVGHFLSYVTADGDLDAREAFLAAYRGPDRRARADAPLWEAAALLRWSTMPFRELRPDWPHRVAAMVSAAGDRLREAGPARRRVAAPAAPAAVDWLAPARAALDAAPAPVDVFFRDDDAGWDDRRLFLLLDLFRARGLPIDLAVIPAALTPALAARLRALVDAGDPVGLHQHGWSHVNHEPEGRACEFGPARPAAAQRDDILAGREALAALLGDAVDPLFTPPWNRCTGATGAALAELGFRCLSREARAAPLAVPGLDELPVHVDWFARRGGRRLDRAALGDRIARHVGAGGPVGVMFHHAVMDAEERRDADALLALVADHPNARPRRMRELAPGPLAAAL